MHNVNLFLKFFIILLFAIFSVSTALTVYGFDYGYTETGYKYVKHKHSEFSYQHAWCTVHKGIEEYENRDKTRVDCLTEYHAVEFDFANKWAESVGQAEHYARMTGKRGKVVLILENPRKEKIYYKRVKELGKIHNFDVEYVTPRILHLDKDGKCPYIDCKCHKLK